MTLKDKVAKAKFGIQAAAAIAAGSSVQNGRNEKQAPPAGLFGWNKGWGKYGKT